MSRLERENNRLKSGMGEGGAAEQIAILQAKLDDATALNATYEEKLRSLTNQRPSSHSPCVFIFFSLFFGGYSDVLRAAHEGLIVTVTMWLLCKKKSVILTRNSYKKRKT